MVLLLPLAAFGWSLHTVRALARDRSAPGRRWRMVVLGLLMLVSGFQLLVYFAMIMMVINGPSIA